MKRWVIGDVHGCFFTLSEIINKFVEDDQENVFIFVGDLIDRGPHSREVVSLVRSLVERKSAICLRGNHEQMAIDCQRDSRQTYMWLRNGGDACIDSYKGHEEQLKSDIEWFSTLPIFFEDEKFFVVHAGIDPDYSFSEQIEDDLLWIRGKFYASEKDFGKVVVFGHTPFANVVIKSNFIGIDTACVYGKKLTAYCLDTGEIYQVEKHEVDGVFKAF